MLYWKYSFTTYTIDCFSTYLIFSFHFLVVYLYRYQLILGVCLLQFEEQKDQVAIEQILRVVFLDPARACPVSIISIVLSYPRLYLHVNNFHMHDVWNELPVLYQTNTHKVKVFT